MKNIRIGTRGSALALWQAQHVANSIRGQSIIKVIKTGGDNNPEMQLGDGNAAGFFTKEIEKALLEFSIDVAVHSLKDLPIQMHPGLVLGAAMERDSVGDLLLVRPEAVASDGIIPLRAQGVVGASSLRRKALFAHVRPDAHIEPIRGNIPTRVKKCISGQYDAIVISRAGPERLGLDVSPLLAFDLNPMWWPGSPGQASVAVQVRADDRDAMERVMELEHAESRQSVDLERALHSVYGGGCHTPFGAYAWMDENSVSVVVAALGQSSDLRLARFQDPDMDQVYGAAKKWIEGGCLESNFDPEKEGNWLCRPAQAWC